MRKTVFENLNRQTKPGSTRLETVKMILVTGPAFSGKREYARSILSGKVKIPGGRAGLTDGFMHREGESFPEEILTEVQEMVEAQMDEASLAALADSLCRRSSILTASETGAGIVPTDRVLRRKRELQGRFLCILAQRADCVVRVFYGLPEVIKPSQDD